MIASVAGEYHWSPHYLGDLFLDAQDRYGLEYWYNIVVNNDDEVKKILDNK